MKELPSQCLHACCSNWSFGTEASPDIFRWWGKTKPSGRSEDVLCEDEPFEAELLDPAFLKIDIVSIPINVM